MKIATLTLAATLALPAAAYAQGGWSTYDYNGSPWTDYQGTGANSGWSGESYHYNGTGWTDTTIRSPDGETEHCSSYHYSGTGWTDTNCN